MSDLWCPFAVRDPIAGHTSGSGGFLGGGRKLVHHSTEGGTYAGARSTYGHTGSLPHFTDSFEGGKWQVWQHLPLDVAASALEHRPRTGKTNRDNAVQVEHVGRAADAAGWPVEYLTGIAVLCRWVEQAFGVERRALLPDVPRLTWPEWHAYSGHLGHRHVPNQNHTDPGRLDLARILTLGVPQPGPQPQPAPGVPDLPLPGGDDMTDRKTFDAGTLDDQGNGGIWFDGGPPGGGVAHFPAIAWDRMRGVWAQGSFPPIDGYRGLPKVGPQERGGFLFVELQGGAPHGPVTLIVDVAA